MLKIALLLIAALAWVSAVPAADSKSLEKPVTSPPDLKSDATFWWGYRPVAYRAYYARPRSYGYYAPYYNGYNSYWRSGWHGYNYYW